MLWGLASAENLIGSAEVLRFHGKKNVAQLASGEPSEMSSKEPTALSASAQPQKAGKFARLCSLSYRSSSLLAVTMGPYRTQSEWRIEIRLAHPLHGKHVLAIEIRLGNRVWTVPTVKCWHFGKHLCFGHDGQGDWHSSKEIFADFQQSAPPKLGFSGWWP